MAKQSADHHNKVAEHHEQAAHQHKQTRRAMRRTNTKRPHRPHPGHGYSPQAIHHGTDRTKSYVEHHGNNERSNEDGTYGC
jgi:hypothetical protein